MSSRGSILFVLLLAFTGAWISFKTPHFEFQFVEVASMAMCGTDGSGFNGNSGYAKGAKLFKQNCATCHKLNQDMTGPALKGATTRVPGGREWIYDWVRNPAKMIESGDAYAVEIYEDWNSTQMTAFPSFTNEDIDEILNYIGD